MRKFPRLSLYLSSLRQAEVPMFRCAGQLLSYVNPNPLFPYCLPPFLKHHVIRDLCSLPSR
jgi:hypothetical protein